MSEYEYGLAKDVIVEGSSSSSSSSNQTGSQPSSQQQQEKQTVSQQQGNENSGVSLDLTTPAAAGSLYGGDKKVALTFQFKIITLLVLLK